MVTPAAKREAVAHVRSVFELSERRACRIIGCVRMTVRFVRVDRMTPSCESGFERWRMSAGGLAIGACTCCCDGRALR